MEGRVVELLQADVPACGLERVDRVVDRGVVPCETGEAVPAVVVGDLLQRGLVRTYLTDSTHSRIFWYVLLLRLSQVFCDGAAIAWPAGSMTAATSAMMAKPWTRPRLRTPANPNIVPPSIGSRFDGSPWAVGPQVREHIASARTRLRWDGAPC